MVIHGRHIASMNWSNA